MKKTTGATQAENIEEAISFYLEGLKIKGEPLLEVSGGSGCVGDAIAQIPLIFCV